MPSGGLSGPNLVAVLGAFALLTLGALRWRAAVMAAMVLAVFEGALRKWAFAEYGQWIYFGKDFLLLGAYVGFWAPRVIDRRRLFAWHPASGLLAAFAALALVELANPSLPSLLVGLFGIRAYLIYVPLIYMVSALSRDLEEMGKFRSWFLVLAVIPLTLGIVQFWAPADSVLNSYAWEDEFGPGVATFGGVGSARITGTFSYITGYTTYLTLIFLIGVAWVVSEGRRRVRWALYGLLGLVFANLLMTGSRGPFLVLGASVPVLLALAWRSDWHGRRRIVVRACVALPLVGLLATALFPEAQAAFLARARHSEDLPNRLAGILYDPLWAMGEAGLLGYGIGSTHQARAFLLPADMSETSPPPAEGEWERIILEVGPVGFAVVLLTRIFVASWLWRAFRASVGAPLRPYLATALLFSLINIPGNLVFNHTASIFYWFLAGFGLMAPKGAVPVTEEPGRPALRVMERPPVYVR